MSTQYPAHGPLATMGSATLAAPAASLLGAGSTPGQPEALDVLEDRARQVNTDSTRMSRTSAAYAVCTQAGLAEVASLGEDPVRDARALHGVLRDLEERVAAEPEAFMGPLPVSADQLAEVMGSQDPEMVRTYLAQTVAPAMEFYYRRFGEPLAPDAARPYIESNFTVQIDQERQVAREWAQEQGIAGPEAGSRDDSLTWD